MDQALDILTEARALWPADDDVAQRLGTALAMANKPAEALKVLEPYLAAHPADHERTFLALRALYEAKGLGRDRTVSAQDSGLPVIPL
jgi:predicted Zn-dependent protease